MRRGMPKYPEGRIYSTVRNGRTYHIAHRQVDGRTVQKWSLDRAVCERWLAGRGWETARAEPRYVVAAETNPMTAAYHFVHRGDWRMPKRIIVFDTVAQVPVTWLADSNGGRGFTLEEARMRAGRGDAPDSVRLTPRPMKDTRYIRQWDK